jgi:dienelactone hydrolase
MIKVDGYDAYVAEPKGKTVHKDKAILFLPDVISIWENSKLMADQYAANGYYTIIVDLFRGDPLALNRPADFDFPKWLSGHPTEKVDPVVAAGLKHLKDKGFSKIGSVGYCFGAKYVCRFMNGKGIDVGYSAHPVSTLDSTSATTG